jgi:hypothetical protein
MRFPVKAAVFVSYQRSRSRHDGTSSLSDDAPTAVFYVQLITGLELTCFAVNSYELKSEGQIEAMSPLSTGGKVVPVVI